MAEPWALAPPTPIEGIPFSWIERQTAGAARLGIAADKLLADALIIPSQGDDDGLVSPAHYLLLCLTSIAEFGDAHHGLARRVLPADYPVIGARLALSYRNLDSALLGLARLYMSASPSIQIQITARHGVARVSISIEAWEDEDAALIEEVILGWLFMHCLHFLGYPPSLFDVHVRDPAHFNLGRAQWAMGGLVRLGKITCFHFPRRLLGEPSEQSPEPDIFWRCQKLWLDFVGARPPHPPIGDYVKDQDFIRFSDLALASGKSATTVRNELKASIGGFRADRQRTLVVAASARLQSTSDSVEAIAADLGYSDARSFRRFFKNATGHTPQQIREGRSGLVLAGQEAVMKRIGDLAKRLDL